MAGRTTLAAGLVVAALSGGCGTVTNLRHPTHPPANAPDAQVCRIYGGVRGDWSVMIKYPWDHVVSYFDYVVIPVMATLDLACTTVGDTITLPYTVVCEVRRALHHADPAPVFAPPAPTDAKEDLGRTPDMR